MDDSCPTTGGGESRPESDAPADERHADALAGMVRAGMAFDDVEAALDGADLDDEGWAALCLLALLVQAGERTGRGAIELAIEAIRSNGDSFGPVEPVLEPPPTGATHLFQSFVQDIAERRRSIQLLAVQNAIAIVLAEADTAEEAIAPLLRAIGSELGWEFGAYWTLGADSLLRCEETWTATGLDFGKFEQVTRRLALEPGVALAGRVWTRARPAFVHDITANHAVARRGEVSGGVDLKACVALPLLDYGEVRGVIEYYAREPRREEPAMLEMMETLASQIGRFLTILSERSRLVDRLARLSLTDELTGLPNRRAWNDGLKRELARADRAGETICVALLDIDRFKAFNDEHGHPAGDALLRETADAWRMLLRASDLLARYGGEEFMLALPAWPLESALAVVDRLRAATPGGLTCSAGLVKSKPGETPEQVTDRADAALYEAKRCGRDRTVTLRDAVTT